MKVALLLHIAEKSHYYFMSSSTFTSSDDKGQFFVNGTAVMSFADQFYALAGQVRPS